MFESFPSHGSSILALLSPPELLESQKYFPKTQKTMIRWLDEIIADFDHRTSSGLVEGINNQLKLIKRSAYV